MGKGATMKLFNYLRLLGVFTDGYQRILVDAEPADRTVRRVLEEAKTASELAIRRRSARLAEIAQKEGTPADAASIEAQCADIAILEGPAGKLSVPLQFLQDGLVRRLAGVQNNACIHDDKDVAEVHSVFKEFGIQTVTTLTGLTFGRMTWSELPGQKPKLMLHAQAGDEPVVIRLEAASELAPKFLLASQAVGLRAGDLFDLKVEAVDPAAARNQKAGREVMKPRVYVNHNLRLRSHGLVHDGHPPKGERFQQKRTMEQMERLFDEVRNLQMAAVA
jgi:hypothetical protein